MSKPNDNQVTHLQGTSTQTSALPVRKRIARGTRPGPRFAGQVAALAGVFRQYGIVVGTEGQTITAEQLEALAEAQQQDQETEARLQKALTDFLVPYSARAVMRAAQLASALHGARGALMGNAAGLEALKKARFNKGGEGRGSKKPVGDK